MRPIPLALAAGLTVVLVQGCDSNAGFEYPDCGEPIPVAVTGLGELANLQLQTIESTRFDYVGVAEYPATPNQEVPIGQYVLGVATTNVVAEDSRSVDRSVLGGFIGSAKATTCPPRSVVISQRIADIDIVSDADLSDDLRAGSSLKAVTDLYAHPIDFPYQVLGDESGRHGSAIPADADPPSVDEFVASEPLAPLVFDLILTAEADEVREHRFSVTYALENGDVFTATSDPVTLAPKAD